MATRFYLRENGTAPVTVAVDAGWESSASPFASKPMFTTTDAGDTLTNSTGFTSTAAQDRCHRQWISPPLAASLVFDTGVTYKAQMQCLESAANDNLTSRMGVRVVSEDGTVVRHTVLAIANYGSVTEWATAYTNRILANADAGTGSYTTVAGDRLVFEVGHRDATGTSISGSSRWGSAGSTDLGENDTSTSATERPWFEMSLTTTFPTPQSLSMSGVGTATNVKSVGVVRAFTGVGTASMVKQPRFTLGMAATGAAGLVAGLLLAVVSQATAVGTALLTNRFMGSVVSASIATGSLAMSRTLSLSQALAMTATGTLDLVAQFIGGAGSALIAGVGRMGMKLRLGWGRR